MGGEKHEKEWSSAPLDGGERITKKGTQGGGELLTKVCPCDLTKEELRWGKGPGGCKRPRNQGKGKTGEGGRLASKGTPEALYGKKKKKRKKSRS